MKKKKIAILGSTGSIGINTLKVISSFPSYFEVVGLSTNGNIGLLSEQIKKFKPKIVAVCHDEKAFELKEICKNLKFPSIYSGFEGLIKLIKETNADLVVIALSGTSGLIPVLETIKSKKNIALANKESLVSAGSIIIREARKNNVNIIPIDSEHSAIFQCLKGEKSNKIRRLILTASGGPFFNYTKKQLKDITLRQSLNHPKWNMGKKVTIDSATLMNKGFEIIEAHYLFNIPIDSIDVVIQPECVVHSMVEFIDGSILAQIGAADMRIPIQYALSYPERLNSDLPRINITHLKNLKFYKPDVHTFPCLNYARYAAKVGGTLPTVLSGSSEMAVKTFLNKQIKFINIPKIIKKVMDMHKVVRNPSLNDVLSAEKWAEEVTRGEIQKGRL
ncbi:MAG: 1-deoxy-D-xylulose-5-phosphate reductoisomerase [Candidatus Firestonebacteria bacterium]